MTRQPLFAAAAAFVFSFLPGCSTSPPPPAIDLTEQVEAQERARAEELKRLEGVWVLNSSQMAGELGAYSQMPSDGSQVVIRIRDGVLELKGEDETWLKQATLSVGTEPQCLEFTQADAVGQLRVVKKRYQLDGDTLTTALDNQFPEHLPESFDLKSGVEHQRLLNTYVRKK